MIFICCLGIPAICQLTIFVCKSYPYIDGGWVEFHPLQNELQTVLASHFVQLQDEHICLFKHLQIHLSEEHHPADYWFYGTKVKCCRMNIYLQICSDPMKGFTHFLFLPRSLGKWSNLTCAYISNGWLVQPPTSCHPILPWNHVGQIHPTVFSPRASNTLTVSTRCVWPLLLLGNGIKVR